MKRLEDFERNINYQEAKRLADTIASGQVDAQTLEAASREAISAAAKDVLALNSDQQIKLEQEGRLPADVLANYYHEVYKNGGNPLSPDNPVLKDIADRVAKFMYKGGEETEQKPKKVWRMDKKTGKFN